MPKKLPEGIRDSVSRGIYTGKEYLASGEYICPCCEDFIAQDVESIAGHALGEHGEALFNETERIEKHSEQYRKDEEDKRVNKLPVGEETGESGSKGPSLPGDEEDEGESGGVIQTIKSMWPF